MLPPLGALRVPPPEQVVLARAGVAMVTPAGRVSENARLVTGLAVALVIVNWSVLALPGPIVDGSKDLTKAGWAIAAAGNVRARNRIDKIRPWLGFEMVFTFESSRVGVRANGR